MLATIVPASLPISVQDCRKYLNAPEDGDDDALIETLLRSAIEFIEDRTNLRLSPATLQYRTGAWPCVPGSNIDLPASPVRDVESVSYLDINGAEQTIAESQWTWRRNTQGKGCVSFLRSFSWPALLNETRDLVFVTFTAGFDITGQTGSGDDPDLKLPSRAKAVVLMLTKHWYDNPGLVTDQQTYAVDNAAEALIAQLRIFQ